MTCHDTPCNVRVMTPRNTNRRNNTMNRIIASIALALVASLGFVAAPASANYGTQVCVADPLDPQLIHTPRVIEDGDDTSDLAGMIVRPLPQNATGCASYNGVPLDDSWETPYPGERSTTQTAEQLASCKANAVRLESLVTFVAGERDALKTTVAAQADRIAEQRATIKKLRAQLRRR